jgi:hypothetical protein
VVREAVIKRTGMRPRSKKCRMTVHLILILLICHDCCLCWGLLSQPKETIVVCSLVDVYCYEFLPRASFEWLGSKEDLAFLFCIAYDWLNGSVIRQLAGDFRFYGITGQHFDLQPSGFNNFSI